MKYTEQMTERLRARRRLPQNVPAAERMRYRDQGAREALSKAIASIEKLGIERRDFARVKTCLEGMIADRTD